MALTILTVYILPIIYDSFVTLVLALFFLFIFRIKDPSIRILFFFLPLIKPFLVIAEKFEPYPSYISYGPISSGGLRIPDPGNIFRRFESSALENIAFVSDINYILIIIASALIFIILILRWINLYLFYRRLAFEEKVGPDDVPQIYGIMDKFAKKIAVKAPDVSLTNKRFATPFIVGVKNVTMVICPSLFEILEHPEKETIIHHELSHIKRKDNLISWIAMMLRDILFFNPFAYIAYFLIRAEQDSGSDKVMIKYSGRPIKEIAKSLLSAIMKLKSIDPGKAITGPAQSLSFSPGKFFSQHRLKNRIRSILRTGQNRIRMRVFPRIMMFVLFFLILILQIFFVINIDDLHIYLR
jgi:beta-lactamase regulating signal transducer with metallopeptidase domain